MIEFSDALAIGGLALALLTVIWVLALYLI